MQTYELNENYCTMDPVIDGHWIPRCDLIHPISDLQILKRDFADMPISAISKEIETIINQLEGN